MSGLWALTAHRGSHVLRAAVGLALAQWGEGEGQVLGADAGEVHRGFGLVAVPAQLHDDPFAECRMFHVVADPQPEVVGVRAAGAVPLAGLDRRLDDPVPMDVGAPLVGGAGPRPRRRYGGTVLDPQSARGRRLCRP